MAERLGSHPRIGILNEVVLNQVVVRSRPTRSATPADDRATRSLVSRLQAEGTCWAGGSVWQGGR